jgi:hypothetical protein
MKNRFVFLALVACGPAFVLAGACGGSDNSNADGGNDATMGNDAANDANTGSDTNAADGPSDASNNDTGTEAGTDSGCAGMATGACFQCCAMEDPDASAALATQAIACACTTPGDCTTACGASLCKTKPTAPDTACLKCLASPDAGDCIKNAESVACGDADTACQAVVGCFKSCK